MPLTSFKVVTPIAEHLSSRQKQQMIDQENPIENNVNEAIVDESQVKVYFFIDLIS